MQCDFAHVDEPLPPAHAAEVEEDSNFHPFHWSLVDH
jgi:hypothetical protein